MIIKYYNKFIKNIWKGMVDMTFNEILQSIGVNPDAPEWSRAKTQLYVNLGIDTEKVDCLGGQAVRFTQKSIRGTVKIGEREGVVFEISSGLMIVCPAVDDMPLTILVDRKLIRIVEAESKLLKSCVTVKTNDELYEFKVPKKQVATLEKMINKVRNK